jgi:CheY-like chemotaxis protein
MILLIDDDPHFRNLAQQEAGLQPLIAAAGAFQADKLIGSLGDAISLALVDLDLADIDGFEVIRKLKRDHPSLPIIAISGVHSVHVLESARCFGADEVLSKPISPAWFAAIQRVGGVCHTRGTGNFRCVCGERLLFGPGPGAFTPLTEIKIVGKKKQGRCPQCGLLHFILFNEAPK